MTFVMYRCTTPDRAAAIMAEVFKPLPGTKSPGEIEGVWLTFFSQYLDGMLSNASRGTILSVR